MQEFLPALANNLPLGQTQRLHHFLEEVKAGRIAADAGQIQAALAQVGEFLPPPAVDPTEPVGYNTTLATVLANLGGLYQEIDRLESVQAALGDLNRAELERIELGIRDLTTVLVSAQAAAAANSQWTDVFFETFGTGAARDLDPVWHTARPATAGSGTVQAFLPLFVDPEDRSLKLLPGGDFSRSLAADGSRVVHGEVEELLGLSVDPNHPLDQAIDGRLDSYWRELILTDAPIEADPLQVPWLPPTYQSGAACRLHFHFPFAVPFTEVLVRPFARYPAQILQVVWDNRKAPAFNLLRNNQFSSGSTAWTSGGVVGTVVSFPGNGGYQNRPYARVLAASGRTTLTAQTVILSGAEFAYHLVYKVKPTGGIRPLVLVNWLDPAGNAVRSDWDEPTLLPDQWQETDKLYIAPSGAMLGYQAQLVLVADGSGTISYTDFSFSRTTGGKNLLTEIPLEADSMRVELENATGTDCWLVLAQPHYEFLQVALPEGEFDSQDLWQQVRLQAEAQADTVLSVDPTAWRLSEGVTEPERFPIQGSSLLLSEMSRLGGRIREMAVQLLKYARPNPATRRFNKYSYVLGAWEVTIKHREYASQGLYVTRPYQPRGEVRELEIQTNPGLDVLPDRVRFWLTARVDDKLDKAKRFFGRATFGSATESPGRRADTHFALTPVTQREQFDGTDRQNRVPLKFHPYADRDRIWMLQTFLSSGALLYPLAFDPNRDDTYLAIGTGTTKVKGYRPLKVSLEFANGTVARPDLMGKTADGDLGFAGPEILASATVEQEMVLLPAATQQRIQYQLNKAKPKEREALRQRLVNQGLLTDLGSATAGSAIANQTQKRTQTLALTALSTRFKKISSSTNGVALSLYWHKPTDDTIRNTIITSGDVLIAPAKYTVDAENGVILLKDGPPNGNPKYTQIIAYYYYQRVDGSRQALEDRVTASLPTSGIDFGGTPNQALPVTRNMTDYVRGNTPSLQPANLDDLQPDYYPVYEYMVDDRGRVVFANNLSAFGDTPAKVTVEYESLMIQPRLIIEITPAAQNEFSTKTPFLADVTILMNARR